MFTLPSGLHVGLHVVTWHRDLAPKHARHFHLPLRPSLAGLWPGYVGPFVEQVVPLLQQRGVVRQEYTGRTLREHLQEF